ncbi:RE1 [Symbiodinium sp. CCMP2592]|nr:RE1 [Symbiodinium sp. CCMP2592]
MNGLRVAAKAWNLKLANVVKKVGLNQCPTEPSVFEGTVKGKRFLMLCYVDDLILCGSSDAIKLVTDTLNRELKIKETGRITPTGGSIVFLGREIERHGEHLRMRVPSKYMEGLFETDFCKDLKALSSPPDLVKIVEKGRADPKKDSLLTEAAAMRYRAVLGRIAWWGQSRPDLARWMSILSQGQSKPTACFEHALRQVIRFLKSQYLCWHYYGPGSEVPDGGSATLDVYADASWAPQAELSAILTAVQESEGLATLIGQLERIQEAQTLKVLWCPTSAMAMDDMTDSQADTPRGSMEAPYWCKQCKWLFKNNHSHGLGWTDEYKPLCEKCNGEISVWGSNASHAFHLREGEKEKRFAKGNKGEGKSSQWVQGDGGKGDGANQGESPMAKAVPRPDGPPSVVTLFPELNGSEVPAWYTELWGKMGVRGAPLDQMDLQPLVESLSGEDVEFYKKSFEKLSHPNFDVYEHGVPMPGIVMAVLDMRSQYGGKSVIWETAMNGGCIYVEMSPGLSGLAVLMFVQYLKRKGFLVLILLSGHQDQGILRMLDLLYTLPILGVERCTKDDLETTSHPPWVCRWKEHAQKGNVVFATMLPKVYWMSDLTCQTIKVFDPKMKDLGKPLPLWAYFAYTNNDVVKESLSVDCDHMAVKLPTGVLESIREPVIWQCDCAWHVASDYASRFNTNLPCILWEHIWKFLGGNTQKLVDVELSVEQAVLAAVAAHDLEVEAEKKRKRRAELDAAEEEAAKKARLEQPSPSSPPASPVFDGAMIAQIAEMVNAQQDHQMGQRVAELEQMKDAAKDRRSQVVEKASEKADEARGAADPK